MPYFEYHIFLLVKSDRNIKKSKTKIMHFITQDKRLIELS